jgi:hypothetical protein
MLHIITPTYRFELLGKIYNSICTNDDIRWHIAKSDRREDLGYPFIHHDKRITLYNVDCEDNEIYKKRNAVLEQITDGYFCFLDDDTIFHKNMYTQYSNYLARGFKGMLIGQQLKADGSLRLLAKRPAFCHIDTGNVLSYHSCLKEVQWPQTHIPGVNHKDFLFWDAVYNFYDKKCELVHQPISHYNKLNPMKM